MPYELYVRTGGGTPRVTIVPSEGRVVLNSVASRIFEKLKIDAVQILWDRDAHMLALKNAKKTDDNVFAVTGRKNRPMASVSIRTVLRWIGWSADRRVNIPAAWNSAEKMLEIKLPTEHVQRGGARRISGRARRALAKRRTEPETN